MDEKPGKISQLVYFLLLLLSTFVLLPGLILNDCLSLATLNIKDDVYYVEEYGSGKQITHFDSKEKLLNWLRKQNYGCDVIFDGSDSYVLPVREDSVLWISVDYGNGKSKGSPEDIRDICKSLPTMTINFDEYAKRNSNIQK